MQQAFVKSSILDGIGTIVFFHPQSNSMPGEQLKNLAFEINKLGENDAVKIIVLKSEGEKSFCAGASFDELITIKNSETGLKFFTGFAMVINAMRKAPKFIIARLQGKAVGGGVGIASAADYTFALDSAAIKLSELAIGIGPFVVGPSIERKIGTSAFCQLTINASEWHSATWAKEKGLYAETFSNAEQMDNAIETLSKQLAASNSEAMKLLKEIMWKGTENWDELLIERAKISGNLVLSDFTINAINKFKHKS